MERSLKILCSGKRICAFSKLISHLVEVLPTILNDPEVAVVQYFFDYEAGLFLKGKQNFNPCLIFNCGLAT